MSDRHMTPAGIARVSYRLMELDLYRKVGMNDLTNIDRNGVITIETCGQRVSMQLARNEWDSHIERVVVEMRRATA